MSADTTAFSIYQCCAQSQQDAASSCCSSCKCQLAQDFCLPLFCVCQDEASALVTQRLPVELCLKVEEVLCQGPAQPPPGVEVPEDLAAAAVAAAAAGRGGATAGAGATSSGPPRTSARSDHDLRCHCQSVINLIKRLRELGNSHGHGVHCLLCGGRHVFWCEVESTLLFALTVHKIASDSCMLLFCRLKGAQADAFVNIDPEALMRHMKSITRAPAGPATTKAKDKHNAEPGSEQQHQAEEQQPHESNEVAGQGWQAQQQQAKQYLDEQHQLNRQEPGIPGSGGLEAGSRVTQSAGQGLDSTVKSDKKERKGQRGGKRRRKASSNAEGMEVSPTLSATPDVSTTTAADVSTQLVIPSVPVGSSATHATEAHLGAQQGITQNLWQQKAAANAGAGAPVSHGATDNDVEAPNGPHDAFLQSTADGGSLPVHHIGDNVDTGHAIVSISPLGSLSNDADMARSQSRSASPAALTSISNMQPARSTPFGTATAAGVAGTGSSSKKPPLPHKRVHAAQDGSPQQEQQNMDWAASAVVGGASTQAPSGVAHHNQQQQQQKQQQWPPPPPPQQQPQEGVHNAAAIDQHHDDVARLPNSGDEDTQQPMQQQVKQVPPASPLPQHLATADALLQQLVSCTHGWVLSDLEALHVQLARVIHAAELQQDRSVVLQQLTSMVDSMVAADRD